MFKLVIKWHVNNSKLTRSVNLEKALEEKKAHPIP